MSEDESNRGSPIPDPASPSESEEESEQNRLSNLHIDDESQVIVLFLIIKLLNSGVPIYSHFIN